MSNDEIKKFINHSKLYTEVDLEENKKVEEGFVDWVKTKLGIDDKAAEKDLENLLADVPAETTKVLDKVADDAQEDPAGTGTAASQGGGAKVKVTTQDQANSILQNPNATDAERQAAQEFYGAEPKSDQAPNVDTDAGANAQTGLGQNDTSSDASSNKGPQVDTDAGTNAQVGLGQNDTSSDAPNIAGNNPNPNEVNRDVPKITAEIQAELEKRGLDKGIIGEPLTPEDIAALEKPAPQGELDATDTAQTGTDATRANPAPQGELDATDTAQTGTATQGEPTSRLDTKGETPGAEPATQGEPTSRLDTKGETPAATPASNGSLLGRKLDLKTPNLMKAYNAGGKKAMPAIKNMQTALSRLGFDPNGLDGKYGQGTYAAVQAFQKANGLSVDGQAGPGTMAAIKKALDDNFEKNKVTPQDADKPDTGVPTSRLDTKGETPQGGGADAAQATDPNARATRGSDSAFANDPQAAAPKVSKEVYIQGGGGVTNFNIAQMKQKYPNTYVEIPQEDGNVTRGYGPLKNLQAYKKKNPAAKIIGQQEAGKPNAERDGAERGVQTASKDNNMKKAIKEASMNISINGDSAAEVAELAGILKNAGMHDAKPVSDIMPHAHDGHDDMVSSMRLMDQPSPDDSPCGMDEEGVEEDWDNSPDESYADHQTMTHDLSGGINRQKPKGSERVKDPAVALETSIKEQLWAALNEKMTAEGRGRGKTLKASRGEKLNASRGNKLMASRGKDKKTTEGSRGKKSRGKKSRG